MRKPAGVWSTAGMTRQRTSRWHRYWDKQVRRVRQDDGGVGPPDVRRLRQWACAQASGDVLEVAVGTGLNLPHYPATPPSPASTSATACSTVARRRAADIGHPATLQQADAHELPFTDGSFDTVVCTLGLCAIPTPTRPSTR